jgi:hypothetical protein
MNKFSLILNRTVKLNYFILQIQVLVKAFVFLDGTSVDNILKITTQPCDETPFASLLTARSVLPITIKLALYDKYGGKGEKKKLLDAIDAYGEFMPIDPKPTDTDTILSYFKNKVSDVSQSVSDLWSPSEKLVKVFSSWVFMGPYHASSICMGGQIRSTKKLHSAKKFLEKEVSFSWKKMSFQIRLHFKIVYYNINNELKIARWS